MKGIRLTSPLVNGKSPLQKYAAFIFDFIRFGALEYIFLGFVMMVYKFIAD